jgi:transcriptional regulator with XRE-family HTH domain
MAMQPVVSLTALGQYIRAERRAQGLRIDDAAALCGVSVDTLSRLENGHAGVSTVRLLRVLDGLGLTLLILGKADVPALLAIRTPQDDAP